MEKKKGTHEEWVVQVQMRCDEKENKWWNARYWYPGTSVHDRYCKTEQEAHNVLDYAYKMWNGKKVYGKDGTRSELVDAPGGLGVTLVHDKQSDHDMEIIKYKIRRRIVTDWETVEQA